MQRQSPSRLSLLLLLLAGVMWRQHLALPQSTAGAHHSRLPTTDTSAMFLVQCSSAEAFLKDQKLWVIQVVNDQTKNESDWFIAKVSLEKEIKCDFNRTALVAETKGIITLQVLLDDPSSLDDLTCQYLLTAGARNHSAVVTAVNVTSFHLCRRGRCDFEPGRASSSCSAGQESHLDCPEGRGWVVQRRVQGNWTSLRLLPAKRTCGVNVTMQEALLVESEDQDRLTGRAVDSRDVVGDQYRAAYVHPNGTCEPCLLVDTAHATHAPWLSLPAQSSHLVLALSVTVGVLLLIIVVLVVIIVCLYLRRGQSRRPAWWCVFKRSSLGPDFEATFMNAPGRDSRTDQGDQGKQVGPDGAESRDLLMPPFDSTSASSSGSSSNSKNNSDEVNS